MRIDWIWRESNQKYVSLFLILIYFLSTPIEFLHETKIKHRILSEIPKSFQVVSDQCHQTNYDFACSIKIKLLIKPPQNWSLGLIGMFGIDSIKPSFNSTQLTEIKFGYASNLYKAEGLINFKNLKWLNNGPNYIELKFNRLGLFPPGIHKLIEGRTESIKREINSIKAQKLIQNYSIFTLFLVAIPFFYVLLKLNGVERMRDINSIVLVSTLAAVRIVIDILHLPLPTQWFFLLNTVSLLSIWLFSKHCVDQINLKFLSHFFKIFSIIFFCLTILLLLTVTTNYFYVEWRPFIFTTVSIGTLLTLLFSTILIFDLRRRSWIISLPALLLIVPSLISVMIIIPILITAQPDGLQYFTIFFNNINSKFTIGFFLLLLLHLLFKFWDLLKFKEESIQLKDEAVKIQELQLKERQKENDRLLFERAKQEQRLEMTDDIHDGVSNYLISIRSLDQLNGETNISTLVSDALLEIRLLMDANKRHFDDLEEVLNIYFRRNENQFQLQNVNKPTVNGSPKVNTFTSEQVYNIFKCLQELYTNAIKYRHTGTINTTIDFGGSKHGYTSIKISNHCRSLPLDTDNTDGYGIQNIQHRMKKIPGSLLLKEEAGIFHATIIMYNNNGSCQLNENSHQMVLSD